MSLIINADDFGLSESVNKTILLLHKQGVVTSTSLIANGDKFGEAVKISQENPRLGIGVHLCLDGPFNIGKDYTTILDNTGQFFHKQKVIKNLKRFSFDVSEIYKEYCLQIEKILDHKIRISHLDHHHHLHLYFPALRMMIKAAKRYKIRYIRSQRIFLHSNKNRLNYLYRNIHQIYLKSHIKVINGYYEPAIKVSPDNKNDYDRLLELMNYKNKIIEIMLHPVDKNDPETIFFTSEKVSTLLKQSRILNYNDLN